MARVLIISNDDGTRYLYQVAISYQKVAVDIADNIAGGLKKIAQNRPDLIVLDILVPDIGDLVKLRQLKGAAGKMPLIILADLHNTDVNKEASILGASKFLVKGKSSLGELIRTVRKAVKN